MLWSLFNHSDNYTCLTLILWSFFFEGGTLFLNTPCVGKNEQVCFYKSYFRLCVTECNEHKNLNRVYFLIIFVRL